MTIKKRLFISNILMILIPVCITAMIACGCVGAVWYTVTHANGASFDDSEDFYQASGGISAAVEEVLLGEPGSIKSRLNALGKLLDRRSVSLTVRSEGSEYYSYGDTGAEDDSLRKAGEALGDEGVVSSGGRSLYVHNVTSRGRRFQILLYCSQTKLSYRTLRTVAAAALILLAAAVVLSIFFTNRFLTKFVFRRIEGPLELLADGVEQISDGNLDFRIKYGGNDEFAPICRDFNEMALRLKESIERTQRHEESRRQLMADMSHDLRSPLTSVKAYVEGLLDGVAKTPEMQRKYLLTIKTRAEDIDRMVSQIFAFSQMELDEYPLHIQPLRLDEEIKKFIECYGREYAARGLDIESTLTGAEVDADAEQLHGILTNVADNSLKYKARERGKLLITIRCEGDSVCLALADDGPGAREEDLSRLFDPFYRSDPARHGPSRGSGLGLAIVAKSVQRMGGNVRAENSCGGGLTITAVLPGKAVNER